MWRIFTAHPLDKLARRRHRLTALPEALQALLTAPLPEKNADMRAMDILVLDFETTGFSAERDRVVSMGWVILEQGVIRLKTANRILLHTEGAIDPESVKVHHLMPEMLESKGIETDDAFRQLFRAMEGKVLLAHGAVIERAFVARYIERKYGVKDVPLLWLDTLKIEQYIQQLSQTKKGWRLGDVRRRYNLPDYPAHDALMDAIATAELFLAQITRLFAAQRAPAGVLYRASV